MAIGKGTQLESDVVTDPQRDCDPDGGMGSGRQQPRPEGEKTVAPAPDMSAGVTIDPAANVNNDDTF